jgi:hypothetical protein
LHFLTLYQKKSVHSATIYGAYEHTPPGVINLGRLGESQGAQPQKISFEETLAPQRK